MSDSDDEDLKAAIALSLAETGMPSTGNNPEVRKQPEIINIDTSSDEDDDDLDAPQALKRNEVQSTAQRGNGAQDGPAKSSTSMEDAFQLIDSPQKIPQQAKGENIIRPGGFLGIDRKQMEQERLERAKAKIFETSASSVTYNNSKRRLSLGTQEGLPDRRVRQKSTTPFSSDTSSGKLPAVSSFVDQKNLGDLGVQFPDGTVKKTWCYGCPRVDDIKIEEILQKGDLELAVLSAFQIDPEWIRSKLNPDTRVVWVLQARTDEEKANLLSQASPEYQFCFPSMEGQINCMHSKLQLLSHPTHLRVVVPSANLVPYDWGETGVMENIVFIIDLPRLPRGTIVAAENLTEFGKELRYFLEAQGMKRSIINSLLKFDFLRTEKLRFVHSIGGSHSSGTMERTGYPGLGTAIHGLGLYTNEAIDIDLVSASIGALTHAFIYALYLAAQGNNGITEYDWRVSKEKSSTSADVISKVMHDRFRIYFPSRATVARSKGGIGAGGTICFQSKWYNATTFPKQLLRNCHSQRPGILMHNKMLFVRPSDLSLSAWGYVGSANLSESAWGRLVKDRTSKEPKLNIRNWECGVVLPVPNSKVDSGPGVARSGRDMEVFTSTIPVPMVVPGEKYRADDQPWYFTGN